MKQLRDYQKDIASQINDRLKKYKICYFVGAVRIGKTITTLEACELYGAKKVLFVTRKKAISSIEGDYKDFGYKFELTTINYESIHKIEERNFDVVVYDEAHVLSSFAKPAKRVRIIKTMFKHIPCIYLSGTPAIESGSQWYHQFFISDYSPFKEYTTFYKWAKEYVNVVQKDFGFGRVNDYSDADRDKIENDISHILITFSQEDAGFETIINEKVLYCDIKDSTHRLAKRLIKDRVIEGNEDVILADTAVKLQNKVHQIYNGSVIGESGNVIMLDYSKAEFIKERFKGSKMALFYFFKGELDILKETLGDSLTTCLDEFNATDKSIAIQQSGTEGLNLSKADHLIFYNFGFSGVAYTQSRDRMTQMSRKTNDIYFIFEKNGISEKIYSRVKDKKSYNSKLFIKDFT